MTKRKITQSNSNDSNLEVHRMIDLGTRSTTEQLFDKAHKLSTNNFVFYPITPDNFTTTYSIPDANFSPIYVLSNNTKAFVVHQQHIPNTLAKSFAEQIVFDEFTRDIKYLHICYCDISSASIIHILDGIRERYIINSTNPIAGLKTKSELEKIELYGNQLDDSVLFKLVELIRLGYVPNIKHLSLSTNKLTSDSVINLLETIIDGTIQPELVKLHSNNIDSKIIPTVIKLLLSQNDNNHIPKLDLRCNDICDAGAKQFINFIKANKEIKSEMIDLTNCGYSDKIGYELNNIFYGIDPAPNDTNIIGHMDVD